MTDLTALSPAEIDELWAPLHYATVEAYWAEAGARAEVRRLERQIDDYTTGTSQYYVSDNERRIAEIENRYPKLHDVWLKAYAAEDPFRDEWDRRNGWTRAYLVLNNGGHVHRSTECGTCYPSTRFEWLTEQSGKDEAEIVELAGERACTVCYPSAPVETRNRPTKLFGAAEVEAQKARAEKAAKKAAAAEQQVVVESLYDHSSRPSHHVFKTVRGATNYIASTLGYLTWYGTGHPSAKEWISDVEAVRSALAAKGVEYDYDKALTAARKKVVREGGKAQY